MKQKISALRKHFPQNVSVTVRDDVFEVEGEGEYLVMTDDEAQEAVTNYITETLWAFRPGFLADWIVLDEKSIAKLQEACEDCNDALVALVGEDFGDLVEAAVAADGRGHFLSGYDGEEVEIDGFYIYRVN